MKYIGPFLKLNSLSKNNIESQLFHLAKESTKLIVLNSTLGITLSSKELKNKNFSNIDINIFDLISPLLCIYKKGDLKLEKDNKKVKWSKGKIKKELLVSSNAYMTLCLLELCRYYKNFENKYNLLYGNIAKKQLEFFGTYLRNYEGVFVDKKDLTDELNSEFIFENKTSKFKFSDQILMMSAFFNYSELCSEVHGKFFKNFSFDILDMIKEYKDDLYNLSLSELTKICLGLNIFYEYSKDNEVLRLLLDLNDFTIDKASENNISEKNIIQKCFLCLNSIMIYKNTSLMSYKETIQKFYDEFKNIYDSELGLFIKPIDKKEISYNSDEILLYLLNLMLCIDILDNVDTTIIINVFKHHVIESNIIGSWPEVPTLDNPERYKNFSLNSKDLLEEQNFKLPTIPSLEAAEIAPVFIKYVTYNKKKNAFEKTKSSFYTNQNMLLFFLFIHFFAPKYKQNSATIEANIDNEELITDTPTSTSETIED